MKTLLLLFLLIFVLTSCEDQFDSIDSSDNIDSINKNEYDAMRGIGKFNDSNVDVNSFNAKNAEYGKRISETKCASCHKTTNEQLVGPGWKGVTIRRTPVWIMNFITNPDPMLSTDPELMSQLEICLIRMPNQNLADSEARKVLEYMRLIDGAH